VSTRIWTALRMVAGVLLLAVCVSRAGEPEAPSFQTSERCVACHNGMTTASGADFSIGIDWRGSIMANSSRDPYWQASVRRETVDHATASDAIQDECSSCHMPIVHGEEKNKGQMAHVFSHLPLRQDKTAQAKAAADGVSCSVCHQITPQLLGTPESFNGNFVVGRASLGGVHPEFGPFDINPGLMQVMRSSTEGYQPQKGEQIRSAELCASCHTLITRALGPDGHEIGSLPEQVPYQEWLHSDYRTQRTCQSCHMPAVSEETPIARILGTERSGAARHEFVAANSFMQHLLGRYRDELSVVAEPAELETAAEHTVRFMQSQAARISVSQPQIERDKLTVDVTVENLGGHKLPTAYPSRRAWLHVAVYDRNDRPVFESGALRANGSIAGNDNDDDPTRYEPHYREIGDQGEVQIYESILGDAHAGVTTGLLSGVGYLKDNRLLPHGFDKSTAAPEIAVHGDAREDPAFNDHGDRVRYVVRLGAAPGPYRVEAELWYQSIGYRWANNLKGYTAPEPQRFTDYYDAMSGMSAILVVRTQTLSK
jgi:cytochrome c551/c552